MDIPGTDLPERSAGSIAAGTFVALSRITGGTFANPEANCTSVHLHGNIFVDGNGPFSDPDPTHCDWGAVTMGP